MDPRRPLPGFQTEWLENRKRQYRKNGADDTGRNCVFLSLAHSGVKSTVIRRNDQTIHHKYAIYPSFHCHSSHKPAEYPRNLWGGGIGSYFAAAKNKVGALLTCVKAKI
jgi:hypothetical protein